MTKIAKATENALRRVAGRLPIDRTLSAALRRAGLVGVSHQYERKEWNRTVATLDVCYLTAKGKAYLQQRNLTPITGDGPVSEPEPEPVAQLTLPIIGK